MKRQGRVVLLRGLPGSGKSTVAAQMREKDPANCVVVSADSFFVNERTGAYEFNQTGLEAAHVQCQERCRWEIEKGRGAVVVDNCSLTASDAAPYVAMAREADYAVEIVDVESGESSFETLAARNVHGVSVETIRSLGAKLERYTEADCVRAWKEMRDSKSTAALRSKWAAKVREAAAPAAAAAAIAVSGKVRLEVCANNGQAHPVKAMVVAEGSSIADVTKQAAKKAGLSYSAKTRLFDNTGKDVERVFEGMRVFVSADGKEFIPMKLKQTAAERKAAKLKNAGVAPSAAVAQKQGVLGSMHKLSSGCSEIVDGLFVGSGRDGRDGSQLDALRIDTVVNVAADWPPVKDDAGPRYFHIGLLDEPHALLDHVLALAFEAISSGNGVLVHCVSGVSRSAAVVAAFLVSKRGFTSFNAVQLLREKRESVCLNPTFVLSLAGLEEAVTGKKLTDAELGRLLLANGSDPRSFLKKVARQPSAGEQPSHMWWTPQFRPEDRFVVPQSLRNALAIVNAVSQGSCLVEVRSEVFRLHFDFDVVVPEAEVRLSLAEFASAVVEDLRNVMSADEFACLHVSGYAGPWRGQFKYGLHLVCKDVLVSEEAFQQRTGLLRRDLAARSCSWARGEWSEIVDSMESKCIRCLGSDRVVTCSQCRKVGKKPQPDCTWCLGKGMEPARRHVPLYPPGKSEEFGAFSIFPPSRQPSRLSRAALGLEAVSFATEGSAECRLRVLDFLDANGKDAPALMAKSFQLDVSRHETHRNLFQFCYSRQNSMLRDPLVQECRGIIVAQDESRRWSVVALPFLKFFNLDDTRAGDEFDWESADVEVSEKLDGMMVMLYFYGGEWQVASMSVPDGSNAVQGGQTVKQLFLEALNAGGGRLEKLPLTLCFFFELLSPKVAVVVPHEEDRAVLIGARNMVTLREEDVLSVAAKCGLLCAPRFRFATKAEIVQSAASLNGLVSEGYVARDGRGNRLKIKAPSYVALHHLQSGKAEAVDLARVVLNREQEEVGIYFPHLRPKLEAFAKALEEVSDPDSMPLEELAKRLSKAANMAEREDEEQRSDSKSKAEKQKEKAARKAARKEDKKSKRGKGQSE